MAHNVVSIKKKVFANQKIMPEMWDSILAHLAIPTHTYNTAIKFIKDEYGIDYDKSSLSRALQKIKAERTEIVQHTMRENAGAYVIGDLELLKKFKVSLTLTYEKHMKAGETALALQTYDRIQKNIETLFKLAGVNEKVSNDAEAQSLAELQAKFERAKQ
jgi:hypothetical protein